MDFLLRAWYQKALWLWLLWPASLMFRVLVGWRRQIQTVPAGAAGVPVIVVGNITLGGTGKTPLLIALCSHLQQQGWQPGIISRGYGGRGAARSLSVTAASPVEQAGDEAVLIAGKTGCPVVVDSDRRHALQHLLAHHEVDVVLSDDGLQHYRLPRRIEIVVVDGSRLFGNGLCLPAGPLREPVSRLREVDFIVVNGRPQAAHPALASADMMQIRPLALVNLCSGEQRPFSAAAFPADSTLQAVAAIGNPRRFFATLQTLPYPVRCLGFPDHYPLRASDFATLELAADQPIVMTGKDAVKCRDFATANMWYLDIAVALPPALLSGLERALPPPPKGCAKQAGPFPDLPSGRIFS